MTSLALQRSRWLSQLSSHLRFL